MELKLVVLITLGSCIENIVFSAKVGNDNNPDAMSDRLMALEATAHKQAINQERFDSLLREQTGRLTDTETKLKEQTERLLETERMLKQQRDINAALLNRQAVTDEKLKETGLVNEQLLQKLIFLENATTECKSSGLESGTDREAVLLRGARQWSETVAFTAYLDHEQQHLGIDHPIPYNKVLLNEGGAYNPSNGMFTCPEEGFYVFYFQVASLGTGHQIVAKLVVDGVNQVDGVSDTSTNTMRPREGTWSYFS